jgi:hypothetical protein
MFKKGAMFGLDARIALVVFGTIGLISTAALLTTIKQTELTDLINEAKVVHDAYQSYEYDTGSYVVEQSTALLKSSELLTSVKAGWQGPYLTNQMAASPDNLTKLVANVGTYSILRTKDRSASAEADTPFVACASTDVCYLWLLFDAGEISNITINELDKKLDSGNGYLKGRVQKYSDRLLLRSSRIER